MHSAILPGQNIRVLRREKGMSLKALAVAAGLSPGHLGEIERGRRKPSLSALFRISDALGTSASVLLSPVDARYTLLMGMISELPEDEQNRLYKVVEPLVRHLLGQ